MARDPADLPARLTRAEVCALARYGRTKLAARIEAGTMPRPVDRGGEGSLFDRDAVLLALGMKADAGSATDEDPWARGADGFRESRARDARRRAARR